MFVHAYLYVGREYVHVSVHLSEQVCVCVCARTMWVYMCAFWCEYVYMCVFLAGFPAGERTEVGWMY